MKVIRGHRTPLTRQIHESVAIENSSAEKLMNSKGEYNGSKIPRIVIEVGDQVETEDWNGQENKKVRSSKNVGKWNINNMKKRKRQEGECGTAQPEPGVSELDQAELSVVNFERGGLNDNYRKRRRVECGMAQLTPAGQSVAKNGAEKLTGVEKDEHQVCEKHEQNGCGKTQLEVADQGAATEWACGVQQKCGSDKVYRCNLTKPKLSRQRVEKVEAGALLWKR